jgi:hypothetical protein
MLIYFISLSSSLVLIRIIFKIQKPEYINDIII